jgi:class 3 adenylate cyclase
VGSAVNIASRIEHAARPDQILITKNVAINIDEASVENEGFRNLRGLDQPVEVFSVNPAKAIEKAVSEAS